MRILLTGHQGYIGTVMVGVLESAGHEVRGLDSGYFAECVHGASIEKVAPDRHDVRDVTAAACDGVDAVIHLAALSNDPLGSVDAALTRAVNVDATVELARIARDHGVRRFLFSSSCSIYGASGGDEMVGEDAPLRPVTPYAESKVRVEEVLHDLADADFSPVSLRNATAFGWSPRLRLDLVLNDLVARAMTTGVIKVLSDGTPWRPLVHVVDICRVFLAMLDQPVDRVHAQSFNVGFAGSNHRVSDLAEIVHDAIPSAQVVITGETGPDPRSYRVDFSKLERCTGGLRPEHDAASGALELRDRFADLGLGDDATSRFVRLRWLEHLQRSGRLTADLRWIPASV